MPRCPNVCPFLLLLTASFASGLVAPSPAEAQYLSIAAAPVTPDRTATAAADSKREPVVSGVLSAVIIGAGQGYNGQWLKAGLFFGGGLVLGGGTLAAASNDDCEFGDSCGLAIGLGLAWLGLYVWNIVDAVVSAKHINRDLGVAGLQRDASVAIRAPLRRPAAGAERAPARRLQVTLAQLRF